MPHSSGPSPHAGRMPRPGCPPDDAAVMEALPNAQLHRQVRHRPAGVVADEVRQVLQHLRVQDLHGALVEGGQLGRVLLEVQQGVGLRLQLEEAAAKEERPRGESWAQRLAS